MQYSYCTKGTCARQIDFELDGNIVRNIRFFGGCNGNLNALSTLLDGCTVEYIIEKLRGNTCGFKPTSCADQLAVAVEEAFAEAQK